ncbi:undecaprenyl-phosphate galactose phosphotransferase WbaP [Candidatus Pacearchaeota archaeon]|nr:MAG: undecaprenyl-phosphate galactose phosphotransferase WbaP [Candidatus Pacearchaeota archaeon]
MGTFYFKSLIYFFLLIIFDLLAFYTSLITGFFLRKYVISYFFSNLLYFNFTLNYFSSFWWMPAIFIFFIALKGLYTKTQSFWIRLRNLWEALFLAGIAILAIITLLKIDFRISKMVICLFILSSFIIFPIFHFLIIYILHSFEFFQKKTIVLGTDKIAQKVIERLTQDRNYNYKIIGFLDNSKTGYIEINKKTYPILGKIEDLSEIIKKVNIDLAIIISSSFKNLNIKNIFDYTRKYIPQVLITSEMHGISLLTSEWDYLFYEGVFLLHTKNNLLSPINKTIKNIFDLFLGSIIAIFSLPLIGIIAVLIKLTSPGPVFFTQERIGKGGKVFKIYKFRTMYEDAEKRLKELLNNNPKIKEEWEKTRKIKNDPRITFIGKFLRRSSLDELPQIFNVLKGDMSLVGPRPVSKEEIEKYYKDQAFFYFQVKPGITGLWQVSGRNKINYELRVRLDSWYVQNWCLWLDIIILIKTIKVVFTMEGAY